MGRKEATDVLQKGNLMGVFSSSYKTAEDPRGKETVTFVSSASHGLFCSLNDEHLN